MKMSELSKRSSCIQKSGKSVDEAVAEALKELNVTKDMVDIEIVEEASKGFLGLGSHEAVVNVALKSEENETASVKTAETASAVEPAAATEEKTDEEKRPKKSNGLTAEENAKQFLSGVFKAMELEVAIETQMQEDNVMLISLSGENMGIIIGKRGDTLDSLQYLTSLVVNQYSQDYIKITIDTENYRAKRAEALLALSNRLADKVTKSGKKFTLEPMNPYERRIIHANLQSSETVTTFSIGTEPYRKVVIAPKNARPYTPSKGGYNKRGDYGKRRDHDRDNFRSHERRDYHEHRDYHAAGADQAATAQKTGDSYTTTYKADFKPQQHKAEYKTFEEYLEAQNKKD